MGHPLIELDDRAREYFISQMEGDYSLFHALHERLNPSAGKIYSLWPDNADEEDDIYAFEEGLSIESLPNEQACVEYIRDYLRPACDEIVVLSSVVAKRDDTWLSRAKSSMLYHNDEVYRFLVNSRSDPESVLFDLREALHGWHNLVVFLSYPDAGNLCHGDALDAENVNALAEGVRRLAINAYDFDSYLIWDLERK